MLKKKLNFNKEFGDTLNGQHHSKVLNKIYKDKIQMKLHTIGMNEKEEGNEKKEMRLSHSFTKAGQRNSRQKDSITSISKYSDMLKNKSQRSQLERNSSLKNIISELE